MNYQISEYANNVKFKAIMLTPERALQLLENNHPLNRKKKEHKIRQMVRDINDGNWKLTSEAITISDQGRLIDGQNRCLACTIANIPIPVFLCTGISEECIVAMDCGASRNVADAARILDKDIKGINGIAAIARRMENGMKSEKIYLSIQETLSWIDNFKDALEFSLECLPVSKVGITQAPVRAVLARAYYRRPVEETRCRCIEFGDVLTSGLPQNVKEDSAAIRLRNWLQDHFSRGTRVKGKGVRISPLVVYAKTETALNHFFHREYVESLKETSNELFWLPGEKESLKK